MRQQTQKAVDLARDLIAIESTTGSEEPVSDFVAAYLKQRGWQVEKLPVENRRWNIFARLGEPRVVFSTHMDTVPPFLAPSEDADYLYGRGACDAKGVLAAQAVAAGLLADEGVDGIGLLFVVGEERNSAGALAANEWIHRQPFAGRVRYLINGEPTENRLALGTKGSLRCWIQAHGRSAHSAYPELGVNAIEKLLEALLRLRAVELRSDPELGSETLNLGTIAGGTRPNIVPDSASAEVMLRLVGPVEPIKRAVAEAVGSLAEVRFEFEVPCIRLKRIEGFDAAPMAYTTDIPFLTRFGEPLLLGPGSIHDAHTLAEKISKAELLRGVELYRLLARRLLEE